MLWASTIIIASSRRLAISFVYQFSISNTVVDECDCDISHCTVFKLVETFLKHAYRGRSIAYSSISASTWANRKHVRESVPRESIQAEEMLIHCALALVLL